MNASTTVTIAICRDIAIIIGIVVWLIDTL